MKRMTGWWLALCAAVGMGLAEDTRAAGGQAAAPAGKVARAAGPAPEARRALPAGGKGALPLRLAIIRTGSLAVREGLVYAGGDFGTEVETSFSAILVQRGSEVLLFDAGLGARVAEQYRQDMPLWQRPFFRYDDPVLPAVAQLKGRGLPPVSRILLSHSHWDHASGIGDFPGAEVWVPGEELAVVRHPASGVGGAWPSQVASPALRWRELDFDAVPHAGYPRSRDLFGDGSVVLVPMAGHTPGSIGMFVTTTSGRRYFFIGDVVWNAGALRSGAPRFWPARMLVDHDAEATQAAIEQVRRVQAADPGLVVVPAHDGRLQAALGLFPRWLP
jgi:glyoxylase-like metal-dependent hydrolase (beta-lactamase superfamily II)